MGFECIFSYYDKKQEGNGYDTSTLKTFKKSIGIKTEDYPLESLAAIIIKQLARRDILVDNIELFEFTKKKIPFKEGKSGIIIKGQKFDFESANLISVVDEETQVAEKVQPVIKPVLNKPKNILRIEIFDPENQKDAISRLSKRGLKFTPGKEYPILEDVLSSAKITSNVDGMEGSGEQSVYDYRTIDDNGNEAVVSFAYFRQKVRLQFMSEQSGYESQNGMSYGNGNIEMPTLRRSR